MTSSLSTESFFHELDIGFNNYLNGNNSEPYTYRTTNLLVHRLFELPVPTSTGSIIKYKFTTTIGDISFSTKFFVSGRNPETIIEPSRVPSEIEPISGTFKSPQDGTLVLIFDNTFSWFNPKLLSYVVELYQPAFALADKNRCLKSRILLSTTVDDTRRAELRLARANERIGTLNSEIPSLEEKLAALIEDLNQKKSLLNNTKEEAREMAERINYNLDKKNGLCIRCLNKSVLSLVLAFLGPRAEAAQTCKYWFLIVKELNDVSQSSNGTASTPSIESVVVSQVTASEEPVDPVASIAAAEDVQSPVEVVPVSEEAQINSDVKEDSTV